MTNSLPQNNPQRRTAWSGAFLDSVSKVWMVTASTPCSAYSDYSWEEIVEEFGETPLLKELRKPVNGHELRQLALTLTEP